jgi:NAD(P)H-dependent FMN reductase
MRHYSFGTAARCGNPTGCKGLDMTEHPILIISGTNRPRSHALNVSRVLLGFYRGLGAMAEILSLEDLPKEIFDGSAYASKPTAMVVIQRRVRDALGLHVVTPEYNGSFPGVLKYFIDMLKFPESFLDKPVAFVGEASGVWGGLRAVEHLQGVFGYRNAHVLPQRVFIPGVGQKLSAEGALTDAIIEERLRDQVARFVKFARHFGQERKD